MKKETQLTPLKAIREHCLCCCGDSSLEVRLCPSVKCPLYPARLGRGTTGLRLLKLIRTRCKDCTETLEEIKNCQFKKQSGDMSCSLYPYRMGKNPKLKGKGRKNAFIGCVSRKTSTQKAVF